MLHTSLFFRALRDCVMPEKSGSVVLLNDSQSLHSSLNPLAVAMIGRSHARLR